MDNPTASKVQQKRFSKKIWTKTRRTKEWGTKFGVTGATKLKIEKKDYCSPATERRGIATMNWGEEKGAFEKSQKQKTTAYVESAEQERSKPKGHGERRRKKEDERLRGAYGC